MQVESITQAMEHAATQAAALMRYFYEHPESGVDMALLEPMLEELIPSYLQGIDTGAAQWMITCDGQTAFDHGNPHFALSIALLHPETQETIAAVTALPALNTLLAATAEHGAYQMEMTPVTDPEHAVQSLDLSSVDTEGHEHTLSFAIPRYTPDETSKRPIRATGPQKGKSGIVAYTDVTQLLSGHEAAAEIQRTGSPLFDMAMLAMGKISALVDPELGNPSRAAGALLIQEAGGQLSPMIAAANPLWLGIAQSMLPDQPAPHGPDNLGAIAAAQIIPFSPAGAPVSPTR